MAFGARRTRGVRRRESLKACGCTRAKQAACAVVSGVDGWEGGRPRQKCYPRMRRSGCQKARRYFGDLARCFWRGDGVRSGRWRSRAGRGGAIRRTC